MPKTANGSETLRDRLVALVLEWECSFGVAPSITSAISEYDAALLVGHTADSYGESCIGRTSVSRGFDFIFKGDRYQVKGNRPSGKPGSKVTIVGKASNYEWDFLIWILYDKSFVLQEAWKWEVAKYRELFDNRRRLGPPEMRRGECLAKYAEIGNGL